jgi:ABC-type multidrug transport system ATPase subunit
LQITLLNIEKKFNDEMLFSKVNHIFETPSKTALLGINGSGKSTLLQIISGYLSPSRGTINYTLNGVEVSKESIFEHISICAPYLDLIEEMTLTEFFEYHFAFKKRVMNINEMISYLGLEKSKNKLIEKFSSGMKQRVKLAQAFFSESPILLLDEPCTNLDEDGFMLFDKLMNQFTSGRIVIIASNDAAETKYCTEKYYIKDLK